MIFDQYLEIRRGLCQADKTREGFWLGGTVGAKAQRQGSKNIEYLMDGSSVYGSWWLTTGR